MSKKPICISYWPQFCKYNVPFDLFLPHCIPTFKDLIPSRSMGKVPVDILDNLQFGIAGGTEEPGSLQFLHYLERNLVRTCHCCSLLGHKSNEQIDLDSSYLCNINPPVSRGILST